MIRWKRTCGYSTTSPLEKVLQRELEDPLALKSLSGELHEGDIVRVERGAEELELTPVV